MRVVRVTNKIYVKSLKSVEVKELANCTVKTRASNREPKMLTL